ncbi:MAG TPA: alpha/beta hydrolase [Mycobacterium sp.]|nr:alpha/beta hydrolase [Mycobacterium sp.]
MERADVEFTSGGLRCAAWFYRPDVTDGDVPCVVMAHGMSLTRHDGLDRYAGILVAAGVAVLVYDHRYLGDSEGEPRQRVQLSRQVQRRSAIEFARRIDGVDPDRIVVWGYSFSGGSAAVAAAADPLVAGAILAFPFLDGLARAVVEVKSNLRNLAWFEAQVVKRLIGRSDRIPVTAEPGRRAVMVLPGEAHGFASLVASDSPWRNEVLAAPLAVEFMRRPVTKARKLHCPTLIQMGERDISATRGPIEKFARRAPLVELRRYDLDHWQPFEFASAAEVAGDQADWLLRNVVAH